MCGIFGAVRIPTQQTQIFQSFKTIIDRLFVLSETRGKEASGIMAIDNHDIFIYKKPVSAHEFIHTDTYINLLNRKDVHVVIGHTRLVTNGNANDNGNNQPVMYESVVGVHNGIITNEADLWKWLHPQKPNHTVDTETIMAVTNSFSNTYSLESAVIHTYPLLQGAASLAQFSRKESSLTLSTNTGSLYIGFMSGITVFASEKFILSELLKDQLVCIKHIHAGKGTSIDVQTGKVHDFTFADEPTTSSTLSYRYQVHDLSSYNSAPSHSSVNSLASLKKHDFNYERIKELKRCKRCILPVTTPFINFDSDGICNYCRQHKPFTYAGIDALKQLVAPYRSRDGEPDCLIGFSGGRDSSYGLHVVVKELDLHPIAYTYDWGMLSDIGRQNAALVTGKLGVEHVIVSADIAQKRENIQKNILAWLKKPELGMIPLFMAGDKQSEFYMNQLSQRTGLDLIIYCRGNRYEKEEFKAGHSGVRNADPDGVIHNLSFIGKLQMAKYYGCQFLANPAYLNSSVIDTCSAYVCTYFISHQYHYLWHYIPWNETEILSTLKHDYDWQTPNDTVATWRIDDASPAFYNYIYYQVQGFTEHDSLRSHQIREGVLSRSEALKLVWEENKPRHESLQWYFDQINLDGDKVLTIVDAMAKLY